MAKKAEMGNSKKMPHTIHRNNKEIHKERGKMIICNFDKQSPQELPFTNVSGKIGIKIELRLKTNEEFFFYSCDSTIDDSEDLFTAPVSSRKNLRLVYITLALRPSTPGRGSKNAFYLSVVNFKTGEGYTYKVGVMNVTPEMSDKQISYFVKCKITPHYLWNKGSKMPEIESFIDVPLDQFLCRMGNKKEKFAMLPRKYRKLKFPYPKRPRTENTARNVFFDPFEGKGIALTHQGQLAMYGIEYLETKFSTIFPKEGENFKDFFSVPLYDATNRLITHVAVRRKSFDEIKKRKKKYNYQASYNEEKLNQLFDIQSFYQIGETQGAIVLSNFLSD